MCGKCYMFSYKDDNLKLQKYLHIIVKYIVVKMCRQTSCVVKGKVIPVKAWRGP
jgi:hypothetical protein